MLSSYDIASWLVGETARPDRHLRAVVKQGNRGARDDDVVFNVSVEGPTNHLFRQPRVASRRSPFLGKIAEPIPESWLDCRANWLDVGVDGD